MEGDKLPQPVAEKCWLQAFIPGSVQPFHLGDGRRQELAHGDAERFGDRLHVVRVERGLAAGALVVVAATEPSLRDQGWRRNAALDPQVIDRVNERPRELVRFAAALSTHPMTLLAH
ncbi:hypothetical protein CURTO8I2_320035 [Curtobacterium sp. 8I-2]|nr:hypothetical protein CURTO8I2_320035 [Curtobacterium sp. 8I-2]